MLTTTVTTGTPIDVTATGDAGVTASGFRAALRLDWRLVRRSTVLMWLTAAAYMAIEVVSFRSAYPDQASRQKLLELSTSTAVRMMQGVPSGVDSAGGFAVWDGGWMLMLIVGCWAVLTATRLTRGEEDSGRAELVLSRPVAPARALLAVVSAMGIGLAGIAVAAALPLIVAGESPAGATLWGVGLATFGAVLVGAGALGAQLFQPRRLAVAVGLGVTAASFLLRVVANSADSRAWLSSVSPFGWTDRLRPFSDNNVGWLSVPVAAAAALTIASLIISGHRDSGSALLSSSAARRSRLHLLSSAPAFGWRLASGTLWAWAIAVAVSSLVFGLMTDAIVQFIGKEDTYRRMLESMGMDMSAPLVGFLSYIAGFMALPFALFVCWRIGALRQEEADGRLDNLLVRAVERRRLLTQTTGLAFAAACVVALAGSVGLWAGAAMVDAGVGAGQVLRPMAGTLPLVALFTGMSVLVFGLAPRLTVALPLALGVLGYLLNTFGTLLNWPSIIVAVSPFNHLARLPAAPMTATAASVMIGAGVAAAAMGVLGFARRDVVSA